MAQKRPNEGDCEQSSPKRPAITTAVDDDDDFELPVHIETFMKILEPNSTEGRYCICNLLVPREAMTEHLTQRIELQSQFHAWIEQQKQQQLKKMQALQGQYTRYLATTDEMNTKLIAAVHRLGLIASQIEGIDTAYDRALHAFSVLGKDVKEYQSASECKKADIVKICQESNETVQDLSMKLSGSLDEVENLKTECLPFDTELMELEKKRVDLEKHIQEMETRVKEAEAVLNQEREIIGNLNEKIETSEKKIQELMSENQQLDADHEKLQTVSETMLKDTDDLRQKYLDIATEYEQHEQAIEQFKVQAVEKAQIINENDVRNEKLYETIEVLKTRVVELREEDDKIRMECADLEATIMELRRENDEIAVKINDPVQKLQETMARREFKDTDISSDLECIVIPETSPDLTNQSSPFSSFVPLADSTSKSQRKQATLNKTAAPERSPPVIKPVKRVKPSVTKENKNPNSSTLQLPRYKMPRNFLA